MPQIEVTFDIDANGIVNVSAKDLGTGKEQSIRITASSGLSEEEIEQAVKEAEMHAEEDKKKRELVEAKNHADSLIYQTEKTLREMGDKVDGATKQNIEEHVQRLKTAMEGDDAEAIKRGSEELMQASHKVAEAMYQQATRAGAGEAQQQPGEAASGAAGSDEEVVEAEFEEVDEEKK
jgi:molecular chaperone DnaK